MHRTTFKDLFIVVTLFAGVAFAGTSVVRAFDRAPANDNVTKAECIPPASVVVLAPDEPVEPSEPPLQC